MDSLPPIKRPKGYLPVRNVLTSRQREAISSRIHRWKGRDHWRLWEACDIAAGVIPTKLVRVLRPATADSDELLDHALRAVRVGNLRVGNRNEPESTWWVLPHEFARWAVARADLVGSDCARIFELSFPATQAPAAQPATRQRVLESGYSTPELEALFAAIEKFWLNHKLGDPPPNNKVIVPWIEEQFGLPNKAARRIDTVIRSPDAKRGGVQSASEKNAQ